MGDSCGVELHVVHELFNQLVLEIVDLDLLGGNRDFLYFAFRHLSIVVTFIILI